MELTCRKCGANFSVDDAAVPADGGLFPCPTCGAETAASWPALELALDQPAAGRHAPGAAALAAVGVTVEERAAEREALATRKAMEIVSEAPGGASGAAAAAGAPLNAGETSPGGGPKEAAPASTAAPARPEQRPIAARQAGGRRSAQPPGMVVISAAPAATPWRLYAAVGGTAVAAALAVILVGVVRSRPPPPPRMPNPLRAQVAAWAQDGGGSPAPSVEAGVVEARSAMAKGSDRDVLRALAAARGALMVDPGAPAAIATYALALAWAPGWVDDETLDQALGAITAAIGDDPDSVHRADLEEARAWLHIRRQRFEAARQSAERAVQLRPGAPRVRLAEAITRMRSQPREVAAELDALAADPPPRLTLWRGEARLLAGEVGQALALWEGALVGAEPDAPLLRRLAQLWLAAGELGQARERLRELCENGWGSVDDRLHYVRLLAREERQTPAAMAELDAALGGAPAPIDRARVLAEKVAVALAGRRPTATAAELSAWLDEALALAPDLPELLYVAGLADLQAGRREAAIDSLEAAVELRPDRPEVAFVLAQALASEGPEAARQTVAQGLAEAPGFVPLHLMRAWLELQAGDAVAAAVAIRRALDFDPVRVAEDPVSAFAPPLSAYAELGRQLAGRGRKADNPMLQVAAAMASYFAREIGPANAALGRVVRADPNEVGARLYRAILAYRRGQLGPARRDLLHALKADSRHRVVRHYQALVGLQSPRSAGESERIWRDLLEANALDTAARVGLARALWVRGQREDARAEALKVLGVRPDDREALSFFLAAERGSPPRKKR